MAAGCAAAIFTFNKFVETKFQDTRLKISCMKRFLKFIQIWLGFFVILFILYKAVCYLAEPAPNHPYFKSDDFLVIAHRGGRSLGPESTLYTFQRAADFGADVLEMDIQRSKDGKLVVFHDKTVERTTNGIGQVDSFNLVDLKTLDAAYRWLPSYGASFPLRNKGIKIPTLSEVFKAFPRMRMNIEIKDPRQTTIQSLCRLIRDYNMSEKVIVASYDSGALREFRSKCPGVATSAGTSEAILFYCLQKMHLESAYSPGTQVMQVPETIGDLQIVNRRFLDAAHARNMKVHVWTVNDKKSMKRLLELGVDGIMTDYPNRLLPLSKDRKHKKSPG